MNTLKIWLPTTITITLLSGLIYTTVQQSYRQSANDPQIQMAEDIAGALETGKGATTVIPGDKVDLTKSLATFVSIYNDNKDLIGSSADSNGSTPTPPSGVFDVAKDKRINKITWQPQSNVREAIVVIHFAGSSPGYVVVDRSLREVEKRESKLTEQIVIGWIITLILSYFAFIFMGKSQRS